MLHGKLHLGKTAYSTVTDRANRYLRRLASRGFFDSVRAGNLAPQEDEFKAAWEASTLVSFV
jgi:hypothetical protein